MTRRSLFKALAVVAVAPLVRPRSLPVYRWRITSVKSYPAAPGTVLLTVTYAVSEHEEEM